MTNHPLNTTLALSAAVMLAVLSMGCGDFQSNRADPDLNGGPAPVREIGFDLRQNPNPSVPMAALLDVSYPSSVRVDVVLRDGVRAERHALTSTFALTHKELPVLGFRPNRNYEVDVVLTNQQGREIVVTNAAAFQSPPLPTNFPPIRFFESSPQAMEPGVTLMSITSFGPVRPSYLVMVDAYGDVVWYFDGTIDPNLTNLNLYGEPLANGNILVNAGTTGLFEIDRLGNSTGAWFSQLAVPVTGPTMVATDTIHHDMLEIPGTSTLAYLGSERRTYPNYPNNAINTASTSPTAEVIGDTIVEMGRDGTVTREIKLLDLLDPYRMCYDTLNPFWNSQYGLTDTRDWTHANSLDYDPTSDAYLVSLRHQEAVVKISRATGQLVWILGDPARWNAPWSNFLLQHDPVSQPGFQWPFHQHHATFTSRGTIMMFDNGNFRAVPPTTAQVPEYSRVVEFDVDESSMRVKQIYSFRQSSDPTDANALSAGFYSAFISSSQELLTTNNLLVCDGGRQVALPDRWWGQVFELERDKNGNSKVIFHLEVRDDTNSRNWNIYRALRMPLYR